MEKNLIINKLMEAEQVSLAQRLALMDDLQRKAILSKYSKKQLEALKYDWEFFARPKQLVPFKGEQLWSNCIALAGRGWGKTRLGGEWVKWKALTHPGCFIGMVAPTAGDARRVMVQGHSGIETICPPGMMKYEPSKSRIVFSNGSIVLIFSADEPARIRGNNLHFAWCDEPQSWNYEDALDMLEYCMRLGDNPQMLFTMTPLPNAITYRLADEKMMKRGETILISGSTYENSANLSAKFISKLKNRLEGSPLGDQEIHAMILRDIPGALFKKDWIQNWKKFHPSDKSGKRDRREPDYERTVLAVDIAVTSHGKSDLTALTLASKGIDGQYYIRRSEGFRMSPGDWAEEIVKWYYTENVDQIVVEVNQGGDLVTDNIRKVKSFLDDQGVRHQVSAVDIPIKEIHAKKGKRLRAELVSQLYQRGKVWHMKNFKDLVAQMLTFTGDPKAKEKDDYVDSLVYAVRELAGEPDVDLFIPLVGGTRVSKNLQLI